MNEYKKKAFEATLDLIKQLITLSTAVLALSGTFLKDYAGMLQGKQKDAQPVLHHPFLLFTTWALLLLSILCGLLAHGTIIGNMDKATADGEGLTVYASNTRRLVLLQWLFFVSGVIGIIAFSVCEL
jgi:hypothetical protein